MTNKPDLKTAKGEGDPKTVAEQKNSAPSKTLSHDPWDVMIEPGATVLFCEVKFDGWFECIVKSVDNQSRTARLKWRDYSGLAEFNATFNSIGLIRKVK